MVNSVDPEQTLCSAAYGLGLHMTHVTSVTERECLYFPRTPGITLSN